MKILGIDMGTKRIGFAVSDEMGIIAQGLKTYEVKNDESTFKEIEKNVEENSPEEIVIGLPLNMDGSKGPQAKKIIEFCEKLKEKVKMPVKLWDERMSTMEVERIMIQADISRKKRKKKIDKLAAQVILQSYLNAKKCHCEEL